VIGCSVGTGGRDWWGERVGHGERQAPDVGFVVLLHAHAPGESAATCCGLAFAGRAREGSLAVDARHGDRGQKALTLAEQEDAVGNLGGLCNTHHTLRLEHNVLLRQLLLAFSRLLPFPREWDFPIYRSNLIFKDQFFSLV